MKNFLATGLNLDFKQNPHKLRIPVVFITCLIFLVIDHTYALEPDQILIIANSDIPASVRIAQYYCQKRGTPQVNILALPLGSALNDTIIRDNYEKYLAGPIQRKILSSEFAGKIRCLLTTYGVPIKVDGRGQLKKQESRLKQLKSLVEQEKNRIKNLEQDGLNRSPEQKERNSIKLAQLQSEIDFIMGKETNASVDSELSMVLFGNYELYRWHPNKLKYKMPYWDFKSLMVCRLDGPSENIAIGLIDKAMSAEKTGLNGIAYIDSRGIIDDKKPYSFGHFDQSLRDLATLVESRTILSVKQETTEKLFQPGECPRTAVYCGWYSLKKYIHSFNFVDGAVGYHISSWEAINLRDPNSSQWCPAMLVDGITATLGAVAEPYLYAFPEPKEFFSELFDGQCLVEAFYRTSPFNSWQLVLIGDPLYRPFKTHPVPTLE